MQCVKAKIGDTVWVHGLNSDKEPNDLQPVKVVHVFEMYDVEQYVIEIETHIDPILEVRCEWSISDSPDKPIGLWRRPTL